MSNGGWSGGWDGGWDGGWHGPSYREITATGILEAVAAVVVGTTVIGNAVIASGELVCQAAAIQGSVQVEGNRIAGGNLRAQSATVAGTAQRSTPGECIIGDEDILRIANAVWERMVAEGAVAQWLETWQRQGADPNNPQRITTTNPGNGTIDVGDVNIVFTGNDRDTTMERS